MYSDILLLDGNLRALAPLPVSKLIKGPINLYHLAILEDWQLSGAVSLSVDQALSRDLLAQSKIEAWRDGVVKIRNDVGLGFHPWEMEAITASHFHSHIELLRIIMIIIIFCMS